MCFMRSSMCFNFIFYHNILDILEDGFDPSLRCPPQSSNVPLLCTSDFVTFFRTMSRKSIIFSSMLFFSSINCFYLFFLVMMFNFWFFFHTRRDMMRVPVHLAIFCTYIQLYSSLFPFLLFVNVSSSYYCIRGEMLSSLPFFSPVGVIVVQMYFHYIR